MTQETLKSLEQLTILVDCLPMLTGGDNGGAKWAAIGIIGSLTQVRPEWRIVVLCRSVVADELRAALPGAEILVGLDGGGTRIANLRLPRLRDGQRIDAILCPFVGPQVYHPSIPIASIIYDIQFRYYPTFFAVDDLNARARNVADALGQSARVICASDATHCSLLEFYTYPGEQISTIRLRVADRLPAAGEPRQLERLSLRPQNYLLYPANAWIHKNHAMLLVAYALYDRMAGDASLTLVCTGADHGRETRMLEDAIRSMGLEGKVQLLGFLDAGLLATLYDHAYAMVFPSMFEGFGMPVLEAMQRGTPVLCADLPPLRELAEEAALYFDYRKPHEIADALLRLQKQPGLRADLVERGRTRAAPFTDRQRMGEEFAGLIADMATSFRSGRPEGEDHLYRFGQRLSTAEAAGFEDALSEGWSTLENHGVWALGEESRLLLLTASVDAPVQLDLDISPFLGPKMRGQRLSLLVNGHALGDWLVKEFQTLQVHVTADIWNAGRPVEIVLRHPDFSSPHAFGMSADERLLSVCLHGMTASLPAADAVAG